MSPAPVGPVTELTERLQKASCLRVWGIRRSSPAISRVGKHRGPDSIEAHLTIVFAVLSVSHLIKATTGMSLKRFVTTIRRHRTVTISTGTQEPPHADLAALLGRITASVVH